MKYSIEEVIEGLRICTNGCLDKCPFRGQHRCTTTLKATAAEILESYKNKTPYKTLRIYSDGRIEEVSE